jgi:hypothetical protein
MQGSAGTPMLLGRLSYLPIPERLPAYMPGRSILLGVYTVVNISPRRPAEARGMTRTHQIFPLCKSKVVHAAVTELIAVSASASKRDA